MTQAQEISIQQELGSFLRNAPRNYGDAPATVQEAKAGARLIEDFSYHTDAACFLLADFECPPELRAFADALIGVSGGREKFHASDATIAKRAGRSKKWVQRNRDEWTAWQQKANVTFIQIIDNYTDAAGTRHPHEYVMHLHRLAVETTEDARGGSDWERSPGAAIARAARKKHDDVPTIAPRQARGRKREPDAEAIINKNIRTARTLIDSAAKLANGVKMKKELFGSATPYELDPALLVALQESVNRLQDLEKATAPPLSTLLIDKVDTDGGTGGGASGVHGGQNVHQYRINNLRENSPDLGSDGGQNVHHESDAVRAVRVFESVGASSFDVTMRDEQAEAAGSFKTVSNLEKHLPEYQAQSEVCLQSFIVRPKGAPFVQLDDLDAAKLARVEPFAFLSVETSPGNFQAWIALSSEDVYERLRRRLVRGIGADRGASGAMRWPGSVNHKPGRDGFKVRLVHTTPGRIATEQELEAANLLAPVPPPVRPSTQDRAPAQRAPRTWPDYQRCLDEAKRKLGGEPDRSEADKNWSILAVGRGWLRSDVFYKLCELSSKARNRPDYAERTVTYAFGAAGGR